MTQIDELQQAKLRKKMEMIPKKANPSSLEQLRYLRFFLAEKIGTTDDAVKQFGQKWGEEKVERFLDRIEKEGRRPHPKKYHTSIRKPLSDPFSR